MKYNIGAALAAIAIVSGSAFLSPAALAEEPNADEKQEVTATAQLQRDLEARAHLDAATMATDAMMAATDLDLDIRSVGPISVLMASDL